MQIRYSSNLLQDSRLTSVSVMYSLKIYCCMFSVKATLIITEWPDKESPVFMLSYAKACPRLTVVTIMIMCNMHAFARSVIEIMTPETNDLLTVFTVLPPSIRISRTGQIVRTQIRSHRPTRVYTPQFVLHLSLYIGPLSARYGSCPANNDPI